MHWDRIVRAVVEGMPPSHSESPQIHDGKLITDAIQGVQGQGGPIVPLSHPYILQCTPVRHADPIAVSIPMRDAMRWSNILLVHGRGHTKPRVRQMFIVIEARSGPCKSVWWWPIQVAEFGISAIADLRNAI